MSFALSYKVVLIIILAAASGSSGGAVYYYQQRASNLASQVSSLTDNTNSLNGQIATLKAEIANLTFRISQLQTINLQLNQTSLQLQSLEAQLASANSQLQSLETQLADEVTKLQSIESSFTTQLTTLNTELAQDQTEIAQLQAQISQLQQELQQSSGLCLSGKTITIGALFDLTDGLSVQGVRAKDASQLAIDDINSFLSSAGCNLRFTVSVSDYALDSTIALAELQAFATQGVQVVIGPLNTGTLQFLIQFADVNHIVLISPSSTSAGLAIPASSTKYFFRSAPDDRWQGMADARMIQTEGASKLIILQRHDTYGDALANATAYDFSYLLTNNNGRVDVGGCTASDTVCVIQYVPSIVDFTATIATLYSAYLTLNATSVNKVAIDAVSFEEFSQMIYQVSQQRPGLLSARIPGCGSLPGCTGAGPTSAWTGTDGEAQDTVVSSNYTSGVFFNTNRLPSTIYGFLNNSKTVRLYQTFGSTYPGNVCDNYCLATYDDVWLAALATLQAGSSNGTRIQAMMTTVAANYYGVTGWNGFDSDGDRMASIYEVWKVVPSGTSFGWTFAGYWMADSSPNGPGTTSDFNPY